MARVHFWTISASSVNESMTIGAQGDEILFTVIAQVTPCLDVMDLQVSASSTALAPPSITPQDFLM